MLCHYDYYFQARQRALHRSQVVVGSCKGGRTHRRRWLWATRGEESVRWRTEEESEEDEEGSLTVDGFSGVFIGQFDALAAEGRITPSFVHRARHDIGKHCREIRVPPGSDDARILVGAHGRRTGSSCRVRVDRAVARVRRGVKWAGGDSASGVVRRRCRGRWHPWENWFWLGRRRGLGRWHPWEDWFWLGRWRWIWGRLGRWVGCWRWVWCWLGRWRWIGCWHSRQRIVVLQQGSRGQLGGRSAAANEGGDEAKGGDAGDSHVGCCSCRCWLLSRSLAS